MIVVMRVQKFEIEQGNFSFEVALDFSPMIGYLPVYETLEDAKRGFPDGLFSEVREKK